MRLLELLRALLVALMLGLSVAGWAAPQEVTPQEATPAQVEQARDQLRADPNLQDTQTQRRLALKNPDALNWLLKIAKILSQAWRTVLAWFMELARVLSEAGRLVVWGLGGLLVLVVAMGLRRWLQMHAKGGPREKLVARPTHVHEMDIRPESLPEQVGSEAWALWQRGERHAALSLLYRATLSRLVHVHAVPITSASTEGECIQLARADLTIGPLPLVEQIIDAWRLAVYGSRTLDAVVVQALCQRFDTELSLPPASARKGAS